MFLKDLAVLMRYKVSLAVTFSAAMGYLLYDPPVEFSFFSCMLGVFILSGGASALNQVQERKLDAKMDRTQMRPLPDGRMSFAFAFLFAILLVALGITLLWTENGIMPAILGLFNVVWYNLLYTRLKRVTPYAIIPGSLTGAIPVLMGWTAAGGSLLDPLALVLAGFVFIWQIPHFWLLLIKYGKQYEKAGFASLTNRKSVQELKRIVFGWVLFTSLYSLLFIHVGLIQSEMAVILFLLINLWLVVTFYRLSLTKSQHLNFKGAFQTVNLFMAAILLLTVLNGWF